MGIRRVDIITMGCSKNLVDSERLLHQFRLNGFRVYHNPKRLHGDVAVVNTCGFIGDAKEESVNMILYLGRARRQGKLSRLYVMGCLSERYMKELVCEIPEVDRFCGKFDYNSIITDLGGKVYDGDCGRVLTTPAHYAYVKIAEGCDRRCAYCAIPLITGRHRSRPVDDIVAEVRSLVAEGVSEFQLIAQELTYYGLDLYGERRLAELVSRVSDIPGVEWVRLHYGYPNSFPYELLPVMRERDNVCKYLDIALQHSSNRILQLMHRNTTREYQSEMLQRIREEVPGIALRTTFMVGFPGEADEDFDDLLSFVREHRFERMGAFAYSEEEGTFAANNYADDIPASVKEHRLSRLMTVQQRIAAAVSASRIGQTLKTVIDRREGDYFIGRTEFDSPEVDGEVLIPAAGIDLKTGHYYNAFITDAEEFDLMGVIKQ